VIFNFNLTYILNVTVTKMDFQTTTTHVVIEFNEKTKNGKESIDVLPISWTYYKKGKLFSKYPYEDEYQN